MTRKGWTLFFAAVLFGAAVIAVSILLAGR